MFSWNTKMCWHIYSNQDGVCGSVTGWSSRSPEVLLDSCPSACLSLTSSLSSLSSSLKSCCICLFFGLSSTWRFVQVQRCLLLLLISCPFYVYDASLSSPFFCISPFSVSWTAFWIHCESHYYWSYFYCSWKRLTTQKRSTMKRTMMTKRMMMNWRTMTKIGCGFVVASLVLGLSSWRFSSSSRLLTWSWTLCTPHGWT